MKILIALILGVATAYGQAAAAATEDKIIQLVRKLAEEVRQLNIELTALKLALHEMRAKDLDQQLRSIATQQQELAQEDSSLRGELAETERQLTRGDLTDSERAALEEVRTSFLTESPRELRQEALALQQKEIELRKQVDQERLQATALQQRLHALTRAAEPVN